jgi:uracil-xanthine permease
MARRLWELHGDGRTVTSGAVVRPEERLSWGRTAGIGMQHVVAMFGATFLVPVLTGFPPATTILFSGIGTLLFLVITRNQVPSYLGSSFAFIAPVIAAKAEGGIPAALGGIVVCGVLFFLIGLLVDRTSSRFIEWLMPPVVTGAIVALIGLNLAPVAKDSFAQQPLIAFITLAAILLIGILFKGFIGRLSVFLGVLVGYLVAAVAGEVDFGPVGDADWVGLPDFNTPTFTWRAIALIAPVVIVLIAENTGHVKAVAAMTERNLDDYLGKAYMGDGAATALAGLGGGSGTTTYAENIGVMAATKVYSTAAYVIAGVTAILLGLVPKFGALIVTIPLGVLGGATTVLYGMIAVLGARIWIENRVDFRDPVNLVTGAVALIVGAANYTLTWGDLEFNGIALGSFGAIVIYQVLRALGGAPATGAEPGEGAIASPAGGVAPAGPAVESAGKTRGPVERDGPAEVEGAPPGAGAPVADPPAGGGPGAGEGPGDRPAQEP